MNPAVEGKVYPEVSFVVEPERLAAFRRVVGVTGASAGAGVSPGGVPPTFATAAEFTVFPRLLADPELDLDLTRVVHGSQEYVYARSLVEGETLQVRARIETVRVRGANGFLTVVMELVGADGEVACTARSMMVERAVVERPTTKPSMGEPA